MMPQILAISVYNADGERYEVYTGDLQSLAYLLLELTDLPNTVRYEAFDNWQIVRGYVWLEDRQPRWEKLR